MRSISKDAQSDGVGLDLLICLTNSVNGVLRAPVPRNTDDGDLIPAGMRASSNGSADSSLMGGGVQMMTPSGVFGEEATGNMVNGRNTVSTVAPSLTHLSVGGSAFL